MAINQNEADYRKNLIVREHHEFGFQDDFKFLLGSKVYVSSTKLDIKIWRLGYAYKLESFT